MRRYKTPILGTIALYFGCVIAGKSFTPFEWGNSVSFVSGALFFIIWYWWALQTDILKTEE